MIGLYSAGWVCIRQGRLFIRMLVARTGVFLVRIIRNRRRDGWVGWGSGEGVVVLLDSKVYVYVYKRWSWQKFFAGMGGGWSVCIVAVCLYCND